jgi:hypothetical protein
MTKVQADKIAAVLGGRAWQGGEVARVYFGFGRHESWLTVGEDGSIDVHCGRGVTVGEVERALVDAGLAAGTERATSYGTTVLDDVRMLAQ